MQKVVPSQIVEYLDARFQEVGQQINKFENTFKCDSSWHAAINTIIELLDQLPPYLLTISGEDFIRFVEAVNELKGAVSFWSSDHATKMKHVIYKMRDGSKTNPITVIRMELAKCPDQGVEATTTELNFIKDLGFRETLRQDVSFVNQALKNAEWKAATILSGSIIEALLLDAVNHLKESNSLKYSETQNDVLKDHCLGEPLEKKPSGNPNNWTLHQYIHFSATAKIISETTAKGCLVAKDFRNLIHPGASIRKNITCDRGSALKSVGGMLHVINDLS